VLYGLGRLHRRLTQIDQAVASLLQRMRSCRELGEGIGEAMRLGPLATPNRNGASRRRRQPRSAASGDRWGAGRSRAEAHRLLQAVGLLSG
jgi:hypothetical protein